MRRQPLDPSVPMRVGVLTGAAGSAAGRKEAASSRGLLGAAPSPRAAPLGARRADVLLSLPLGSWQDDVELSWLRCYLQILHRCTRRKAEKRREAGLTSGRITKKRFQIATKHVA